MPKYRPHGTSKTIFKDGQLKRQIVTRTKTKTGKIDVRAKSIPDFSHSDAQYILSSLISTIDKVARKPKGSEKITLKQFQLRHLIGTGVLSKLGVTNNDSRDEFIRRLHPYIPEFEKAEKACLTGRCSHGNSKECVFRHEEDNTKAMPKGGWYYAFFGKVKPWELFKKAKANAGGERIYRHVLAQYQKHGRSGELPDEELSAPIGNSKQRGLTAEKSVLKPYSCQQPGWGEKEWEDYTGSGRFSLPRDICNAACAKEKDGYAYGFRSASEFIFAHYAKLFPGPEGKAIPVRDLNETQRRLLALHDDVKGFYKKRMSGEKSQRAAEEKSARAHQYLPQSWEALRRGLGYHSENADLMSLVRTGKVIHYSHDEVTADLSKDQVCDIEESIFWTSASQEEIKRAEAFVRVWRTLLGFCGQSFADWVAPGDVSEEDVLFRDGWRDVEAKFHSESVQGSFEHKAARLFGRQAQSINSMPVENRFQLASHMRTTISELRNASFHFKGLERFVTGLANLQKDESGFADELWQKDTEARTERMAQDFYGAEIFNFMVADKADYVLKTVVSAPQRQLAIPKFSKLVARYLNAWVGAGRDGFAFAGKAKVLPSSTKRKKMEADPALRCQYVCLKALYESAFPAWLSSKSKDELNVYLHEAQVHTTKLARNFDKTATSRVEKNDYTLATGETLWELFDRLGHDVATTNRPQKGYDPDKDTAKANSEFLENFKRDTLMLAFVDFVHEADFGFLGSLEFMKPTGRQFFSQDLLKYRRGDSGLGWQRSLYLILHFCPVGLASLLNQQFQKWRSVYGKRTSRDETPSVAGPGFADAAAAFEFTSAVSPKDTLDQLMHVIDLYLDMHDAKFIRSEGEDGLGSTGDIDAYFENSEIANAFFPDDPNSEVDGKLPIRGLREMLRFGANKALDPVCKTHVVTLEEAARFRTLEDKVQNAQKKREDLHDAWIGNKNGFMDHAEYKSALSIVSEHRLLAARLRLTDHVTLYRIAMRVLGRLLDYAGMWERDIYFVFLALCRDHKVSPSEVLNSSGRKEFEQGRILSAFLKLRGDSDVAAEIKKDLLRIFHLSDFKYPDPIVKTRNTLAHYGAMRPGQEQNGDADLAIDLTSLMNETRRMMSYDRKQKNNISRSIKTLLERENIEIQWSMEVEKGASGVKHNLSQPKVVGRTALHLEGGGGREKLLNDQMLEWVATLFKGEAKVAVIV